MKTASSRGCDSWTRPPERPSPSRPTGPGTSWPSTPAATGAISPTCATKTGFSRLTVMDRQNKIELTPPNVPDSRMSKLRFDRTGKRLAFLRRIRAIPCRRLCVRPRAQCARALDAQRSGPGRPRTLSSRRSSSTIPPGIASTASRARFPPMLYRPRSAGPHPVIPSASTAGPKASTSLASSRSSSSSRRSWGIAVIATERARLGRLWQDLPQARRRHAARGFGEGHRLAARPGSACSRASDRERLFVMGALVRAATCPSPRSAHVQRPGCAAPSTW